MLPTPEARRVPGPNLYTFEPGAVIEATWPVGATLDDVEAHTKAWREEALRIGARLGWPLRGVVQRRSTGTAGCHVALFLPAPLDQLDTAIAVAECAWEAAVHDTRTTDAVLAELDAGAQAERDPGLVALVEAADGRGLVATIDDDGVSVGAGVRSQAWPRAALPEGGDVAWDALGNVPIALVTGSNGKTTVTRLAAAILRAAGHTVGTSTTDGVRISTDTVERALDAVLEAGDWAGPGGARRVLRDLRVTAAVLETARGGLLRRGLAVRRATVAVVTNVAADHLGEYGINDLDSVAEAKLVVARALRDAGTTLVLPADDPVLVRHGAERARQAPFALCWTLANPDDRGAVARIEAAVATGERACAVRRSMGGDVLAWHDGQRWRDLVRVDAMPLAEGGRARHNVANASSAVALAIALGAPMRAVQHALRSFGAGTRDNPGRLERFTVGGVTVVVDYAHNPAGLDALHAATREFPAARRLLLLGQAGDRDDAALDALARSAWDGGCIECVVLKELPTMRRGRAPGEVPARLRAALLRAGAHDRAIENAPGEIEGVRAALAWARAGDLLLLPLHESREAIVRWLDDLAGSGWQAGSPVPHGPAPGASG